MVKLIRIVSEDNCNFNANLEAGISLGEGASMALQNLTFENRFIGLEINSKNNEISFNLDTNNNQTDIPAPLVLPKFQPFPPFLTIKATLKIAKYDSNNYKDFYEDLIGALNGTLSVAAGINGGDIYGGFRMDLTDENRPIIRFKYSPLCLLFNNNKLKNRATGDGTQVLFNISTDNAGIKKVNINRTVTGGASRLMNNMNQYAANPATNELINYIYPTIQANDCGQWSRGSAFFGCSVYHNITNAGDADTNGFGIGLSYTDIEANNGDTISGVLPIDNTWRDYEILIEDSSAAYRFISPDNPNAVYGLVRMLGAKFIPYSHSLSQLPIEINLYTLIFGLKEQKQIQ